MIDASSPLPTLPAGKVHLRWIDESDLEGLFAIFGDARVTRYWSTPALEDRAAAERLLADIHGLHARGELHQWGIADVDGDTLVGTSTLCAFDWPNRRAEIGFALARARWRQGLARAAVTALLEYAFGPCDLHRIEADVDPDNEGSIRLLERLGFRREGLLRERWLTSGEPRDSLFYGLLRADWEAQR